MENNLKKYSRDKIMVFLLALIPRLILIIFFAGLLRTPMDEMSTIATGAYFGGKDWTALTADIGFYYGGGFSILFAPFFRLIDNPVIVYYIMLFACAVLQSISAPISYHIMHKYLKIQDRKYLFLGAIACSFMVVTRAMVVFNEHVIIGCMWVVALLVCRLVENHGNYKKRAVDTVLLMLIFSYVLTIHARVKVIWIAFAIMLVCYRFFFKRWLVAVIPAVISGAAGYWLAGVFNTMVKTVIWKWQEGEFLRNTSVRIDISLSDFQMPVTWQGITSIIFGQTNTVLIFTGGLAVLMVVMLVYFYIGLTKERFTQKKALSETGENHTDSSKPIIFMIAGLFLLCVGAMIAAQSITWLEKVITVLKNYPYDSQEYGYKAFTYVRYLGPFTGPLFLSGLGYIYLKKDKLKNYILPAVLSAGVLQLIWLGFILPHITKSRVASEVFAAFGFYDILPVVEPIGARVYLMGTAVFIVIFSISMIAYYKKNLLLPLALVMSLLIYEYCYGAIRWDNSYVEYYAGYSDAGVEVIERLEADEEYAKELPEQIYVYDSRRDVQKKMYAYQMNLSSFVILPGRPEDKTKENIVLSSEATDDKLEQKGYVCGKLDDNEYVYVNSEEYLEMFESQGVEFNGR